jgi:hypothetical protein
VLTKNAFRGWFSLNHGVSVWLCVFSVYCVLMGVAVLAHILDDLKGRYGERVLLSPQDLVEVLGVSVGQQANLRSQGKFPIPTKKIGNLIKVSIYDLAKYLSGLCDVEVKKEYKEIKKTQDKDINRLEKKKKKGLLETNWWLFKQDDIYDVLNKSLLDVLMPVAPANKRILMDI